MSRIRWNELLIAVYSTFFLAFCNPMMTSYAKVLIIQDQIMKMSDKQTISTAMLDQMQTFAENRNEQQKTTTTTDYYDEICIDDGNLLIGARNVFLNISLTSLTENKRIVWNSTSKEIHLCRLKQKTSDECQNYIRVIVKLELNVYLVCGTNAYYPLCRTYKYDHQTGDYFVMEEELGIARCPYGPSYNSTALYTDGKLYSATAADVSSRDSLIYSRPLRTEQHDSQWLNDPQFVNSFDYADKVYFFFRETAIENINCGKVVFSRVARVCKNDPGGGRILRHTWTSFFKARLNCSIPGKFPFYFDEIQSTTELGKGNIFPTLSRNDRSNMIYAVFSTPRNSIRGSAVCAYKMSDIVKSFEGPFKEQKAPNTNWLPVKMKDVPFPHPAGVCSNGTNALGDHTLNFIKSHPLMDNSVPLYGGQPILVQTGFHFTLTQIAVDWQVYAADRRYYDVLFIATDDGRVIKAINRGKSHHQVETVVIEVLQIFDDQSPIKKLKVFRNAEHGQPKLLAISANSIRTIPLHRCQFMNTCSSCVALRDPYCSWFKDTCTNSYLGYQSIDTGQHVRCLIENITKHNIDQSIMKSNQCHSSCKCCSKSSITNENSYNSIDILPHSASALSRNIQIFSDNEMRSQVSGPCYTDTLYGNQNVYSAETMAISSILCTLASLFVGCLIGYGIATYRHSRIRAIADKSRSDAENDFCHSSSKIPIAQKPMNASESWSEFGGFGRGRLKQLKMILNPYGQSITISNSSSPQMTMNGQPRKI